ncbi:MAG TPA: plastocyanin/azurin family copper-binding protein [Gemmatimonadales bacterium]|nr:plastocyanin/azurin family copper-binding protein [Gemmatimonadales bacterium]
MHRITAFSAALLPMIVLGCGGDGGDINQPGERPANSVSIVARAETKGTSAFSPNPLSVAATGTVHWYNDDKTAAGGPYGGSNGTSHNITADDLSFTSGNLAPDLTFEHTFTAPGTYPYHCSIHPTMKGTITVTE